MFQFILKGETMHTLPQLPYAYNALEPYIDSATMKIHHTKHHQAYIDNLANSLSGRPDLLKLDLKDLLSVATDVDVSIRQAVINNAGGHANHSFFWKIMTPKKASPKGEIKK